MNDIEKLPLTKTKIQWLYIVLTFIFIFMINLSYEYYKYKQFSKDKLYIADAQIINIYPKPNYQVLKLQTSNFICFTKTKLNTKVAILDKINIYLNTSDITYFDYLKGFYTTSFNIQNLQQKDTILKTLSSNINLQHQNKDISSLFNALFFAIPINKQVRESCTNFGVSHLVAISGFHLGILSFIIYTILHFPYSQIHKRYFPYRNKRFDILLITTAILFIYLIFVSIVPSLLRAFVMLVFGIFFLRTNIKILSFGTLALVTIFIIALFPKLIFSLSLWFSIAGVFYIFLFIQYFKNLNKIVAFFFFNLWIYLAINPITHFFFGTLALEQLYSPLFTLGFIVFYPLELFLHLINQGDLLDTFIQYWLNITLTVKEIFTPTWFFVVYISISLFAIYSSKWFQLLNFVLILFNLWIFTL